MKIKTRLCPLMCLGIVIVLGATDGTAQNPANTNSLASELHQGKRREISWWTKWVESVKPFSVYGKVVDDSGIPVEGAKVDFHWTDLAVSKFGGEQKSEWLATDKNGCFTARIPKGEEPLIEAVQKDGYDFKWEYSPYYSSRQTGPQNSLLMVSKDHPVILRLRKKGETRFLISEKNMSFQFQSNESGKTFGYDLIRRCRIESLSRLVLNDEPLICDLQVKATFNTNDATWAVILSQGNSNDGVIASDQMLYEAPQDGYQQEYAFVAQDLKAPTKGYVYLRSREPSIYSRLELCECVIGKGFFRLEMMSVTNPYGDRNLELATDLPYEVTKQLTDEAKTSFRQNKRPSQPDLPRLMNEAKEKSARERQANSPLAK